MTALVGSRHAGYGETGMAHLLEHEDPERRLHGGGSRDGKKAFHDQQMVGRSQEQSLLRTIIIRDQSGRTMKWDEQLDAKVQALTVDQINAAFRKHLDPAQLTIVKAGDFK